jgi:hypothetical protein
VKLSLAAVSVSSYKKRHPNNVSAVKILQRHCFLTVGAVFRLIENAMVRILQDIDIRTKQMHRLASVALAFGLLSGCGLQERSSDSIPEPVKMTDEDRPASKPSPPPAPPAKPPVQSSLQLDPQQLVGLGEMEVTDLLGTPREVREEAPARVWRYAGDSCSVDVLFYFDLTRQQFRALTYRMEPQGRSEQAQRICLGGIQEAQRGGSKR